MTGAKRIIGLPRYGVIKCALGRNRSVTRVHARGFVAYSPRTGDFFSTSGQMKRSLTATFWHSGTLHTAEPSATYVITGKPASSSPHHRLTGRASMAIDALPVGRLDSRWVAGGSVEPSLWVHFLDESFAKSFRSVQRLSWPLSIGLSPKFGLAERKVVLK